MTDTRRADPSVTQNRHGVDLAALTEGEWQQARIDGYRTDVKVVETNLAEDEFVIEHENRHYERETRVVDGDAFRPV